MKDNYKDENKFDAIIRQKMTGLEGVPAFDAWDNITAELDKDTSSSHKIWWGAGAVLLLLIAGSVVLWNKNTPFNEIEHDSTIISTENTSKQISSFVSLDKQQKLVNKSKETLNLSQNDSGDAALFTHLEGNTNEIATGQEQLKSTQYHANQGLKLAKNNFKQKQTTKKSNKTALHTIKKETNTNSIKNSHALIAQEAHSVSDAKLENSSLTKDENLAESIVKVKDIKLLKIGLLKLKNDLQLLDYQGIISKNTSKEIKIKNATRLAFSFTPLRTYKQLIPNLNDSIIVSRFENTETVKARTSFALTLGMEREVNERWEAEWGINYTRIEQNMNFFYSKKSAPITVLFDTNQNGFDTRPTRNEEQFVHNYAFNYVGIYGGASYRIFRYAKPEQRVGARFTLSTLFNKDKSLNKLQESFTTFYKVSYQLSPYWRFNISPEFTYYFRSTYKKDAFLGAKPYTVGVQLGLVRRFGGKKNK